VNKQSPPELMLVSSSKPVAEPLKIPIDAPIADAPAIADAAASVATGQSSGVELAAVLAGYEARRAAREAEADKNADWRWWEDEENAPAILCEEQLALAVYPASRGDVCFRQRDPASENGDDVCVFILREHIPALIRRLQQLVKA
jgi:hypothetical protein